jgi:hypothetical protein
MKLNPGETYERLLSIRAAAPAGEVMPESVTFRIGCEPGLGYNLSTETPPHIWSDPVTITIRGQSQAKPIEAAQRKRQHARQKQAQFTYNLWSI